MNVKRIETCKEIYTEAFGLDGGFRDILFDTCFKYCKTLEFEGETAAMLFVLPSKILYKDKSYKAGYIFAAATREKYRKKGLMSKLLKETQKGNEILFLKPANEELIEFYEKNGFKTFTASTHIIGDLVAEPISEFKALSANEKENGKFTYTAMVYGNEIPLDNMYFPFIME